jgi:hypothetical protein
MGERVSIRVRLEDPSASLNVSTEFIRRFFYPIVEGGVGNGTEYPIGFTAQELGHLIYGPKTYKANGFSGSAVINYIEDPYFGGPSSLSEPILELPNGERDQNRTELNLVTPNAGYPTAPNYWNLPPQVYINSAESRQSFFATDFDVSYWEQSVSISVSLFNSFAGTFFADIIKYNGLYYPRLVINMQASASSWNTGTESVSATSNYTTGDGGNVVSYNFLGKPLTLLIYETYFIDQNSLQNISLNIGSGISVDKWWTYGNSAGQPVFNDNGSAISNPFA